MKYTLVIAGNYELYKKNFVPLYKDGKEVKIWFESGNLKVTGMLKSKIAKLCNLKKIKKNLIHTCVYRNLQGGVLLYEYSFDKKGVMVFNDTGFFHLNGPTGPRAFSNIEDFKVIGAKLVFEDEIRYFYKDRYLKNAIGKNYDDISQCYRLNLPPETDIERVIYEALERFYQKYTMGTLSRDDLVKNL